MNGQKLKSNLLLLLAAVIWGLAFVAQRVSMNYVGPFTFNGVRFALGSLSLVPLIFLLRNRQVPKEGASMKNVLPGGIIAGCIIFLGASFQQMGIVYTTAGKAGFITGLYIVIVPILGIFLKQYVRLSTWMGVLVAVIGLYLLCVTESFSISNGDMLVLAGSFFFALHILVIDHYATRVDGLKLSCIQFATCSVLSLATAFVFESISVSGLLGALVPILYGGICSVGIAYTLQVIGQRNAEPSHAAIILSMETVVASLGGWIILNENLGLRGYAGCALMLCGMLLSQLQNFRRDLKPKALQQ